MGLLAISKAYENVALNKPAYLQYPFSPGNDQFDASNAVDGRKSDLSLNGGQCAVSEWEKASTWWVNLTSIHSIHHITIHFRTENHDSSFRRYIARHILGFSVYVSNTTDRSQGTLCFKDNNFTLNTIPYVFSTNCSVHGQYVIYYNERLPRVAYPDGYYSTVAIALCEVEVYACFRGFFGQECSQKCIDTCAGCNDINGLCEYGCIPGWKGYFCNEECDKGSYGFECNGTCGYCRDTNQCSNVNGTCLTGCDAGYEGDLCKTQCDEGSYGIGCNETCGHCRDVNQCSKVNGSCLTGCDAGCDSGSYGADCKDICGNCLNESECSNINGTCFTGCNAGYEGDLCKKPCDVGSYGEECNETCGHCRDIKQCFHANGTCLTGCNDGYQGDMCKIRE
uniref:Multiple epidermal growth factor-like domains 10 n=1 Tax=Magallana gigas TaxID=29159 RepID=K1RQK3_MAGGI